MKHSIKTIVALSLSLGVCTFSFAQEIAAVKNAQAETISIAAGDSNHPLENIAETNFSTLFPNASQQKWTSTAGNSFVSFLHEGRKARASFSAKGQLNYVITDCGINNLPAAFSKNIHDNYSSFKLFHAIEIKAYGVTAYQAVMESTTEFITLKYTEDGVEQLQQVKK